MYQVPSWLSCPHAPDEAGNHSFHSAMQWKPRHHQDFSKYNPYKYVSMRQNIFKALLIWKQSYATVEISAVYHTYNRLSLNTNTTGTYIRSFLKSKLQWFNHHHGMKRFSMYLHERDTSSAPEKSLSLLGITSEVWSSTDTTTFGTPWSWISATKFKW